MRYVRTYEYVLDEEKVKEKMYSTLNVNKEENPFNEEDVKFFLDTFVNSFEIGKLAEWNFSVESELLEK